MSSFAMVSEQLRAAQMLSGSLENMSIATFNAGPVNAYAAAVSNLTAQQQAARLAAAGLNEEQIRSVLIKNGVTDENLELAISELALSKAQSQNTAQTGLQIAMNLKKNNVKLSENAANFLLAHSTEVVTEKMLEQAVAQGIIEGREINAVSTLLWANSGPEGPEP